MKKQLAVTMLLVAAFAVAPAFAKKAAPPAEKPAAEAKGPATQPKDSAEREKMKFEKRKEMTLKHLKERIAKMQEAEVCVTAAETLDALRECRPYGGPGRPRMGGPRDGKGPVADTKKK